VCGTTADKDSKKTVQETKQVWCETSKDKKATPDVQKTWREPKDQGTDAASTERHKAGSAGQLRSTAARDGDGPSLPTVAEGDSPTLKAPAAALAKVNGDTVSSRASSPRQTPPSTGVSKGKKASRSSRNTLSGYMSWKECTLADLAYMYPEYYSLEGANTPWGFTPPLTTLYQNRDEENQPDGFERLQEMLGGGLVDEDGQAETRQSFHSVVIWRHDSGEIQETSAAVEEKNNLQKHHHIAHRQARMPSIRTALTEAMLKDMRAHSPSSHWHSGSASRMPSNNSSKSSRRPSLGQDHSTDGLLEVKMGKRSSDRQSERRSFHDVGTSPASRSRAIVLEEPPSSRKNEEVVEKRRGSERNLQRMMSYDSTESLPAPHNRSSQSDAGKPMHATLSVRRPSQGDIHGTVRISRMWSATDEQIVNTLKAHCTDSNKLRDAQELEESGSEGEASHSVSHSRQRSWGDDSGSISTDSDEPFALPAWLEQDTHQNHSSEKRVPSREASSFGSSSGFSPEDSDSSGL